MAMPVTGLDNEALKELFAMGQQYNTVNQQWHTLAEELKNTKLKKRQLAAEVKFLRAKLRSFQRIPELDGPSQAAHDLKSVEAPQFYEVEVKLANSYGPMMDARDPMAVFEFPANPENEFPPMHSHDRKLLWQDERRHS